MHFERLYIVHDSGWIFVILQMHISFNHKQTYLLRGKLTTYCYKRDHLGTVVGWYSLHKSI